MSAHTHVQVHFVKGLINHRIRFGASTHKTKLDKYRFLVSFPQDAIFGYIRWSANEYGTQDWRVYVLKTQSSGLSSKVPGITPAVKILLASKGSAAVKRTLAAIDKIEKESSLGLLEVPESYWRQLSNTLILKAPLRQLPLSLRLEGEQYAG